MENIVWLAVIAAGKEKPKCVAHTFVDNCFNFRFIFDICTPIDYATKKKKLR